MTTRSLLTSQLRKLKLSLPNLEKNVPDEVKSRLYVQVGTQKFGRRTERDVQVKIIFRITLCKVFGMRLYQ